MGPARPGEGEVHLWWRELGKEPEQSWGGDWLPPGLEEVLSVDEITRARKFRRTEDAQSWAEGRIWIRTLLGAYLDCRPSGVTFAFGPKGKPVLADSRDGLRFNLSHSGNWIVLAAASMDLGVDIEALASKEMSLELEGEVFSADEQVLLRSMEGDRRREMFYAGWVRKESLVKASGKGLSVPPRSIRVLNEEDWGTQPVSFDVVLDDVDGGRAGPEASEFEKESRGFSLWDFRVETGVVGAVAVDHASPTFYCWSWID